MQRRGPVRTRACYLIARCCRSSALLRLLQGQKERKAAAYKYNSDVTTTEQEALPLLLTNPSHSQTPDVPPPPAHPPSELGQLRPRARPRP